MSSTGQGAQRVENDFYPTPKPAIKSIADRINWDKVDTFEEPCRGDGAILEFVPPRIETHWCEITEGIDYLTADLPLVDLTLTNPPFLTALEFLARAIAHSKTVTLLLRTNFLGSAKRKPFLSAHRPTHLHQLSERPSFVDVCSGGIVRTTGAGGRVLEEKKRKGCGWAFQKKDKVKECPNCGGAVKAGTDSIEYAWFSWDNAGILTDAPGIHFL